MYMHRDVHVCNVRFSFYHEQHVSDKIFELFSFLFDNSLFEKLFEKSRSKYPPFAQAEKAWNSVLPLLLLR